MAYRIPIFGLVPILAAMLFHYSGLLVQTDSPYYASSWCNPLQPIALIYMGLAHLWVGRRIQPTRLPPPTVENTRKVAVVTGANTGIGFETARTLVLEYHWQVVLACRSKDKAIQAMHAINKERSTQLSDESLGEAIVLDQTLDLSSFDSVRLFAQEVRQKFPKLDVLINNAGRNTSGKSGPLDLLFQSNFLGHFLLTKELLESLQKENGHVINLSSAMHHFSGTRPLDESYWKSMALHSPDRPPETYAASKTAAILFSLELTRRYPQLRSTAVNPGAASSDIWRGFPKLIQNVMKVFFLTPSQASVPVVAAAVTPDLTATYLQPYWLYDYSKPPFPALEMLGPYVGYVATTPRLPSDGGLEAALSLWKVSEELTSHAE